MSVPNFGRARLLPSRNGEWGSIGKSGSAGASPSQNDSTLLACHVHFRDLASVRREPDGAVDGER